MVKTMADNIFYESNYQYDCHVITAGYTWIRYSILINLQLILSNNLSTIRFLSELTFLWPADSDLTQEIIRKIRFKRNIWFFVLQTNTASRSTL